MLTLPRLTSTDVQRGSRKSGGAMVATPGWFDQPWCAHHNARRSRGRSFGDLETSTSVFSLAFFGAATSSVLRHGAATGVAPNLLGASFRDDFARDSDEQAVCPRLFIAEGFPRLDRRPRQTEEAATAGRSARARRVAGRGSCLRGRDAWKLGPFLAWRKRSRRRRRPDHQRMQG